MFLYTLLISIIWLTLNQFYQNWKSSCLELHFLEAQPGGINFAQIFGFPGGCYEKGYWNLLFLFVAKFAFMILDIKESYSLSLSTNQTQPFFFLLPHALHVPFSQCARVCNAFLIESLYLWEVYVYTQGKKRNFLCVCILLLLDCMFDVGQTR